MRRPGYSSPAGTRGEARLLDYLYVDKSRLDNYVEQLGGCKPDQTKKSKKVSLSLKGPAIEYSEENQKREATTQEKISFLIAKLREHNMLAEKRLSEAPPWGTDVPQFFLEETVATPITIPKDRLPPQLGLSALKIWISDPNPKDLNGPEWSFRGSFLYLTELAFDNLVYQSVYSGCSALKFIANAATGAPLLERSGPEKLGRDSADHPIDKLREFAPTIGDARRVQTLYRIRYMTNEQVYTFEGNEHRVHDILGYPVFIASH